MAQDRFKELEALVAVVEGGSFVKAAEILRSSKAAVSRSVVELETRLGARLLHRTTRRLALTEEGRQYYERAKQLLEELEEADGLVSATTRRAVGLLKINAPLTFGVRHLAPLWSRFLAAHPGVELDVTLSDRVVDLVEEGVDVAIRITRLQDSTLVFRRLASSSVVLCATPRYLELHGTPRSVAELAEHQIIAYSYWSMGNTWSFQGPGGPQSFNFHPRLRANNGDTCVAAALDHQGLIFQPTFLVGQELANGHLLRLLPEWQGPELGIYAVYPTRKHLSGKVRALVDFLADAFALSGDWGAPSPANAPEKPVL